MELVIFGLVHGLNTAICDLISVAVLQYGMYFVSIFFTTV